MIDLQRLLEEYQLWPMDRWNYFDFVHQLPRDVAEQNRQIDVLKSNVSTASGVYAYCKHGEWLYVGKAAPLFTRLKIHYHESYEEVPGDTKDHMWHRFFSSNRGRLAIYWKQVESETDRRIIESALTELLKPTFSDFARE